MLRQLWLPSQVCHSSAERIAARISAGPGAAAARSQLRTTADPDFEGDLGSGGLSVVGAPEGAATALAAVGEATVLHFERD